MSLNDLCMSSIVILYTINILLIFGPFHPIPITTLACARQIDR